ncbi:flagellar hook capping FlgD N-terminal domain-containing protein [Loktanella salsilacus]|uniref:flagellar hook capping FlgD N-terminal domain-containing protein n=1 Tax=Loktanella salsilacus TaxID=195913 RepID=UPI00373620B1
MDINTIATSATRSTSIQTADNSSGTKISSDFETFLKMLTVQMQNQDPLNPVDSADYATQLATFSGVEQQVQTNDLLRSLVGQSGTGGLAQLAGWVGMQARAAVPAYYDGAPVSVVPNVQSGADAAQLVVFNDTGAEVQRLDIGLDNQAIVWNGLRVNGQQMPDGYYRFETVSYALGEVVATNTAEIYATVSEVQVRNGVNTLVLSGGRTVAAGEVTAVRNAALS